MDLKITAIISLFVCTTQALRSEYGTYQAIRELPFFVDKTELLQVLFNSSLSRSNTPYHFITCPYNFGKMVNFLMIKKFAEIEVDENNAPKFWMHTSAIEIFRNLKVSRHADIIINHMSRYPVLFLDLWISRTMRIQFAPVMLMNALRDTIVENYEWLGELLEEKIDTAEQDFKVDRKDVEFFLNLFNQDITNDDLDDGLLRVCRLLYNYFNQTRVVLLVDEYEKVALRSFATYNEEGLQYYKRLNKILTRALTEGRKYIQFALIAGTGSLGFNMDTRKFNVLGFSFGPTRAKKNEFITHYPFLDDHPFSPYYGFVEEEVRAICHLSEKCEAYENALLSEGYSTVDGRKICNAASVTDVYIRSHRNVIFVPFLWIEPDFNQLLVPFVRAKVFREKMEEATKYGYFQYPIKKTFPSNGLQELIKLASRGFEKISDSHVDMFFTICLEQGYFTHIHGSNNFTFTNPSMKTQLRRQLSGLVLVHSKVDIPDAILV